jgi:ubiquinone/menaquinone biosynthesis C-methylase UbiE
VSKTIAGFNYMLLLIFEIAKWVAIVFGIFLFLLFVVFRLIRHYFHFPIPAFATQLIDNPYRRRYIQKPNVIADRMQLRPGMIVVEIGPGKGNYTKAVASRILPDGKVYAVDIQESVIKRLKEKVQREKIGNIEPRIDDAHNFSFSDESIDRVLAIACLPEIPNPIQVLRECHRILRRNGLVSLCEIVMDPDYPRRQTEKRWALEAGFKLENEFGNVFSYQLNFKKT